MSLGEDGKQDGEVITVNSRKSLDAIRPRHRQCDMFRTITIKEYEREIR